MCLRSRIVQTLWILMAAGAASCGVVTVRTIAAAPDAPQIAGAIVRGARLDATALAGVAESHDRANAGCQIRRLRHWLIIRSQLVAERLVTGDLDAIDAAWIDLDARTGAILACSPRDGTGWLMKAWIGLQRDGLSESAFRALRYSYAFAPHEGWLSARRNRLVLLRYGVLPEDLRQRALREFADLLAARFVGECASTFLDVDEPLRGLLLGALDAVPMIWKTKFRQELLLAGIEVAVPGVAPKPDRPWNWMR